MSKLSKSVQNCGLHDCTHNCFAITEKEALAAIEVMREAFIEAVNKSYVELGDAYTSSDMREYAIKAIKSVK